jgi:hypothetical protein
MSLSFGSALATFLQILGVFSSKGPQKANENTIKRMAIAGGLIVGTPVGCCR